MAEVRIAPTSVSTSHVERAVGVQASVSPTPSMFDPIHPSHRDRVRDQRCLKAGSAEEVFDVRPKTS
jgi:hypothetical protein